MRKFLSRRKDRDEERLSGDSSLRVSADSIEELQPMFDHEKPFTNDAKLNLNPSISPSVFTRDSDQVGRSMFSQGRSFSTKQSSYMSEKSKPHFNYNYGQPLQILDIAEEPSEEDPQAVVGEKLHQLYQDISFVVNKYRNSSVNLTTAIIDIIECIKAFLASVEHIAPTYDFSTYNNADLRRITKIYLNFYDNLLGDEAYVKLRLLLCKNFSILAEKLNRNYAAVSTSSSSMIKPYNFAVGANGDSLPNEDTLCRIMERITTTSISIREQNGSFIAPILRGVSKELNVLCLYFGYPNPTDYHLTLTKTLHELYDDIHVLVMKNRIELASAAATQPHLNLKEPIAMGSTQRFKLPFRVPTDVTQPPMSLSLSTESSARTSGTMGGFIYPKIDLSKQPNLSSYANSKFAITCGHVCLDKREDNVEYPHVSAPSSVLINLYKQALSTQYQKFEAYENDVSMMEARTAYASALNQLDSLFPMRKVKILDPKLKQERVENRNFPRHRFGQIIWGERTLIGATKTSTGEPLSEKRLSDIAIIKVNKALKCDFNYLGDDITFNEHDPSLMFDNLYVRKVIGLKRKAKELDVEALNEVDSLVLSFSSQPNNHGIPVFKYGSTTKYTLGNLNGIKLVYWLDGAIHSSEFVVNSIDKNSAFASGGDSGSWILSKLEDVPTVADTKGLGVLGMLHSYDGEYKQFGLFTPMTEILDRLQEVTHIEWGVVGVSDKHDDLVSGSDSDFSEESDYDSGDDLDGANPPEVD